MIVAIILSSFLFRSFFLYPPSFLLLLLPPSPSPSPSSVIKLWNSASIPQSHYTHVYIVHLSTCTHYIHEPYYYYRTCMYNKPTHVITDWLHGTAGNCEVINQFLIRVSNTCGCILWYTLTNNNTIRPQMTTYYITLSPSFQCYIIHMSVLVLWCLNRPWQMKWLQFSEQTRRSLTPKLLLRIFYCSMRQSQVQK